MSETHNAHPVVASLQHTIELSSDSLDAEKAVIKHGQPFIGIERPKGFRQRAKQACFRNAMNLALDGRGTYVEGFAIVRDYPVHHAWTTLDGVHAIDTTWPNAPVCQYFGIPFTTKTVSGWLKRQNRTAEPILSCYDHNVIDRLQSDELAFNTLIERFDSETHTCPC
jgi:hypothetical protein